MKAQPLFLDQLAMALAFRQYDFPTFCKAHEYNEEDGRKAWNEARLYSIFYRNISDENIEDILDNSD